MQLFIDFFAVIWAGVGQGIALLAVVTMFWLYVKALATRYKTTSRELTSRE